MATISGKSSSLGVDKDRESRHENMIFVIASPFPSNNWHML